MISGEDFERTIQNFDRNFSLHLMDLLEKLSHYSTIDCEHQMLNIIARLDHNGYYTAQLEKKAAEGETSYFSDHFSPRMKSEQKCVREKLNAFHHLALNDSARGCCLFHLIKCKCLSQL